MTVKVIAYSQFEGGTSTDPKVGIKHSVQYIQAFDFRKNPSQLTSLPGLVREDNGVMKDLVLNEVMVGDGTIYSFGDTGYIYKRTPAGVQSEFGKLSSGCAGIDYRKDTDTIYLTSNKTASAISNVSGTPTLLPDKYNISYTTYNNSSQTGFNVNAFQIGSTFTTPIFVATSPLNEASTNIRYFQTDIEPLNKVQISIANKGTGNWTVTLHDGLNTVLGTSTVLNASLKNGQFNDFIFSTAPNGQVRLYPAPEARTYHIHVTSTVADGTVFSSSMSDLSTCDLQIWADRFVQTNNGLHPMDRFLQYELFQNGNYLSAWEPISDPPLNAEWLRSRLTLPSEYEGCGLDHTNEFSVAAWEQTTTNGNLTPQQGLITFWDGVSDTYNYDVPIPEGSPECLNVYENVVYYYAGGAWWAMTSPTTTPVKMRTMPNTDTEFTGQAATPISVYPYAATVRRGVHLMGFPSKSTGTGLNFGVYSYGAIDKNFNGSFGYSYALSTKSQTWSSSNNLRIGMVRNYGDLLHVSWQDDLNGGYGIDFVNNQSNPAPYSVVKGLTFDNGYVAKPKLGLYVEAYFYIPAGTTVRLSYQINDRTIVYDPTFYSTTNLWEGRHNYARFNVSDSNGGRFHEFTPMLEVFNDGTVTAPPVIQYVGFPFDDLSNEPVQ